MTEHTQSHEEGLVIVAPSHLTPSPSGEIVTDPPGGNLSTYGGFSVAIIIAITLLAKTFLEQLTKFTREVLKSTNGD